MCKLFCILSHVREVLSAFFLDVADQIFDVNQFIFLSQQKYEFLEKVSKWKKSFYISDFFFFLKKKEI